MSEPLFPLDARAEAIRRVSVALLTELKDISLEEAETRAEALIAVAEDWRIPIDPILLQWIHFCSPGKLWSQAEWRRWCEKYTGDLKALAARGAIEHAWQPAHCGHCGALIQTESEARAHVCRVLCPHCTACELLRDRAGVWMCPSCGIVVGRYD